LEHGLNDLNEETLLEMLTFGNAADYPGSKWSLVEKIITLFPSRTTYVEPFFGSGAVYFNKPVSKIETINDLNGRVYNFFKVCRENPGELARRIMLTPHSRQEHRLCEEIDQDPIEDARRFLINSWQSIGGIQLYKTGWRSNIDKLGGKLHEWNDLPERIMEVAGRLKQTQIENQDAIKLLQRYNRSEVLAYVDHPYLMDVRKCRYYKTELEDERHLELLELLKDFKGKVVLSGYDS
jgi:DNA adenine methylase